MLIGVKDNRFKTLNPESDKKSKMRSTLAAILRHFSQYPEKSQGCVWNGLEQMKQMTLILCLYHNQNRSYGKKCVFDLFRDLDLDLDPIFTKNNRLPGLTCAYLCNKYLRDILKIVDARVYTDKQTAELKNRLTDILSKNEVFESNEITQRVTPSKTRICLTIHITQTALVHTSHFKVHP